MIRCHVTMLRVLVLHFMLLAIIAAEGPGRHLFCVDHLAGDLKILDPTGAIVWNHQAGSTPTDGWVLPDGNVLYVAGNGVYEVTPAHEQVFSYVAKAKITACQRLADGTTFACVSNGGRLLFLDRAGHVVRETVIAADLCQTGPRDLCLRGARVLPDGNLLVAHYAGKRVVEYRPDGTKVFEVAVPGGAYTAVRLPDGLTVIAVADKDKDARFMAVDRAGATVWTFASRDLAGAGLGEQPLRFCAGFHLLEDGGLVFANWLGHGSLGKAPQLFELSAGRTLVRHFADHERLKGISSVQVLDAQLRPLPGWH